MSPRFALLAAALMTASFFGVARAQTRPLPDGIPREILREMTSGRKFIGHPGLAWRRQVITVAFENGSDALFELIEETANEWIAPNTQLRFSFRDAQGRFLRWSAADTAPAATIRIGFRSGKRFGGYWSAVGRLAGNISPGSPTLNLEGFPQKLAPYERGRRRADWLDSYEHSTTLHEFGHALGLAHEHFHPACQADLKLKEAIAALVRSERWPEEVAAFNMDAKVYQKIIAGEAGPLDATTFPSATTDQDSVMLYNLGAHFFKSGDKSVCRPKQPHGYATRLSAGDIRFFRMNYTTIRPPF